MLTYDKNWVRNWLEIFDLSTTKWFIGGSIDGLPVNESLFKNVVHLRLSQPLNNSNTLISATDTYTMQFKDNFGAIVPLLNATCDWYCDTIDTDSLASGQVTVNVNKDATSVQLFQLQITHESEMGPNQFQSTIVAV